MAESVQLRLIARGIVGLPIHDSFIAPVPKLSAMPECFALICQVNFRVLSNAPLPPIDRAIDCMAESSSSALMSVFVAFLTS
jgi:hypothetical protein